MRHRDVCLSYNGEKTDVPPVLGGPVLTSGTDASLIFCRAAGDGPSFCNSVIGFY